jgi:glycerophosphoryl diester phosphodiesterase
MIREFSLFAIVALSAIAPAAEPVVVGHRGLVKHAPEETLANFAACIELRVSIELDVRRTRDGQLVCLHDDTVNRTTTGTGKVAELSLREIRQLDAGKKFSPQFAGERIPTLEEVFALLRDRKANTLLVAVDLKGPDCEEEVVKLADKYGILQQLVFIGITIEKADVRDKLQKANAKAACAALCPAADKLADSIADKSASWVYVRFIPTADEVKRIHTAGKKVFLVGTLVMGNEPANWAKGRDAGVDAILTDYPLECLTSWRSEKKQP